MPANNLSGHLSEEDIEIDSDSGLNDSSGSYQELVMIDDSLAK